MDDETFLARFEDCTLAPEAMTHEAHVRLAWLYLRRESFPEALARVRAGLQAFNRVHGVPDAPDRGYHETLTVAWMRLVGATIRAHGAGEGWEEFRAGHPHLFHRTLLRLFYSRGRILSAEAKAVFVEPDLLALPPSR